MMKYYADITLFLMPPEEELDSQPLIVELQQDRQ
jgi:hypothetical protein